MSPFTPKGDRPEWQMIYDLLEDIEPGEVITYETLTDVLGRDFMPNRSPFYRARRHLGEQRQRWMEAIPNVGYRCIKAPEHIGQAARRREFGKRRILDAVRINRATDLTRLTSEELARHDNQFAINTALVAAFQNHEERLRRIEQALRAAGKLPPLTQPIPAELTRHDHAG